MSNLDSQCNFLTTSIKTLVLLFPTFGLIGRDKQFDNNFHESQVIRDARISLQKLLNPPNRFEDYPFFYNFHSSISDSNSSDSSKFFSREDLEKFHRLRSDSVAFPLSALTIVMTVSRFLPTITAPPKFFLTDIQLYRRSHHSLQWIVFLWCFFYIRIPVFCFRMCWKSIWKCLCCPYYIFTYFFPRHSGYTQIPQNDVENPPIRGNNEEPQLTATVVSRDLKVDPIERGSVAKNNTNENQEESEDGKNSLFNNAPIPDASTGNNETTHKSRLSGVIESLEESAPVKEQLSNSNKLNSDEDIKKFENEFEPTKEEMEEQLVHEQRKMELSKEKEEQQKRFDSLKMEEENDEDSEEIRKTDAEFRRKLEATQGKQREEIKRMREKREKIQKETEEDFRKMKQESQERIKAILDCIQLRIRFEEKEEEWSDILKGLRDPLIKVVTSQYALQDEFRWEAEDDNENSENIVEEVNFFAKLVCSAQNVLENAYFKLETLTENYDDRIFLKMIMKAVSLAGHHCDRIGKSLLDLLKTPLLKDSQKRFNDAVFNLNPQIIPTTTSLKNNSMRAKLDEYTDMKPAPFPEWYYCFSDL